MSRVNQRVIDGALAQRDTYAFMARAARQGAAMVDAGSVAHEVFGEEADRFDRLVDEMDLTISDLRRALDHRRDRAARKAMTR